MRTPWQWLFAVVAAGGCGPASVYTPTTGGYAGANISPKRQWVLGGNLNDARAAADGNLNTAARSAGRFGQAELTIDLTRPCVFQTVIIDHGVREDGHCRRVAVDTSIDGREWVERHEAPGTRRITILSMPEVVLARHVRLRAVRRGAEPWSVAEVFLQ